MISYNNLHIKFYLCNRLLLCEKTSYKLEGNRGFIAFQGAQVHIRKPKVKSVTIDRTLLLELKQVCYAIVICV